MERGREQPPGSAPTAVPRSVRRVAHAPMPVSQTAIKTASDFRAVSECIVAAYLSQIAHGTHCTFEADFCFRTRCVGHQMLSIELCSTFVKALAVLDPAGFGLTTPARSSKVALM